MNKISMTLLSVLIYLTFSAVAMQQSKTITKNESQLSQPAQDNLAQRVGLEPNRRHTVAVANQRRVTSFIPAPQPKTNGTNGHSRPLEMCSSSSSTSSASGSHFSPLELPAVSSHKKERRCRTTIADFKGRSKHQDLLRLALDPSQKNSLQDQKNIEALSDLAAGKSAAPDEDGAVVDAFDLLKETRKSIRVDQSAFRQSMKMFSALAEFKPDMGISPEEVEELREIAHSGTPYTGKDEAKRLALRKIEKESIAKSDLLRAAESGKCSELQEILQTGDIVDLDSARNTEGNTALAVAARNNRLAAVKLLLATGMSPMTFNNRGYTPLEETESIRKTGYVRGISQVSSLLKAVGARDVIADEERIAPFVLLQQDLTPKIVDEILNKLRKDLKKYSPNISNRGNTLLMCAVVKENSYKLVEKLIKEFHVYVNSKSADKKTALDLVEPQSNLYKLLRENKALTANEVRIRDEIIDCVKNVKKGSYEQLSSRLAEAAAEFRTSPFELKMILDSCDEQGSNVLMYAVQREMLRSVALLVETYHVDVNVVDMHARRALDYAIDAKNSAIQGVLFRAGAVKHYHEQQATPGAGPVPSVSPRKSSETENEESPEVKSLKLKELLTRNLLNCAREGRIDELENIIKLGLLDIKTVRDEEGNSPLALAVLNSHQHKDNYIAIVNFLLDETSIDINAINDAGDSIYDLGRDAPDEILLTFNAKHAMTGRDVYVNNLLKDYAATGMDYSGQKIKALYKEEKDTPPEWEYPEAMVSFRSLLHYLQNKHLSDPATYPDFLTLTDNKKFTLLTVAVDNSQEEIVEMLLNDFAPDPQAMDAEIRTLNVNPIDSEGRTLLDRAITKKIVELLEKHKAFTFNEMAVKFILLACATKGNVELFAREIAELSTDRVWKFLSSPDAKGRLPLTEAARFGHLKMVKYLVENYSIDLRQQGDLAIAAAGAHESIVRYLKERMTALNLTPTSTSGPVHQNGNKSKGGILGLLRGDRNQPKDSAQTNGNAPEKSEKRTEKKSDKKGDKNRVAFNETSSKRSSAPRDGLTSEEYDMLRQLAQEGPETKLLKFLGKLADSGHTITEVINSEKAQDGHGHTPLALAVLRNQWEAARIFLGHKANPHILNKKGKTAYDLAVITVNNRIIDLFRSYNATHTGEIVSAIQNNNVDLVKKLLIEEDHPHDNRSLAGCAVSGGHMKSVKYFIEDKKVNWKRIKDDNSLVVQAVQNGQKEAAAYFIESLGADVNEYTIEGLTLLDCAQKRNDAITIRYLVSKGALSSQQIKDKADIHSAAKNNNAPEELKSKLVAWEKAGYTGAQLTDSDGNTPLHAAASNNAAATAKILMPYTENNYFNLNATNRAGQTALDVAISRDFKAVESVLRTGDAKRGNALSENGVPDGEGYAPSLHEDMKQFAFSNEKGNETRLRAAVEAWRYVKKGDVDQLRQVIQSGNLSLNTSDAKGDSLTTLAVQSGQLPVLRYLTGEAGLSSNSQNKQGDSLFALAIVTGHMPIVRYLVEEKRVPYNKTNKGLNPLFLAVQNRRKDVALYFIEILGLDVNEIIQDKSPMDSALKSQDKEMIETLRRYNALTASQIKERDTVLIASTSRETENLVTGLAFWQDTGCGLTPLKDSAGNTPLHYAVQSNTIEALKRLVSHSFDINAINHWKQTPLDVAIFLENQSIETNLRQHRAKRYQDLSQTEIAQRTGSEYVPTSTILELRSRLQITADQVKLIEAILSAAKKESSEKLQALLVAWENSGGKAAQLKDNNGNTPFHVAAEAKSEKILKFLVSLGTYFNINAANNAGQTPLDKVTSGALEAYLRSKDAKKSRDK